MSALELHNAAITGPSTHNGAPVAAAGAAVDTSATGTARLTCALSALEGATNPWIDVVVETVDLDDDSNPAGPWREPPRVSSRATAA